MPIKLQICYENKFDYVLQNKHTWVLFKNLSILEYVELKTGVTINVLKIDVFQSHRVKNRITINVNYNKIIFASCIDIDKKKSIISIIKQIKKEQEQEQEQEQVNYLCKLVILAEEMQALIDNLQYSNFHNTALKKKLGQVNEMIAPVLNAFHLQLGKDHECKEVSKLAFVQRFLYICSINNPKQ